MRRHFALIRTLDPLHVVLAAFLVAALLMPWATGAQTEPPDPTNPPAPTNPPPPTATSPPPPTATNPPPTATSPPPTATEPDPTEQPTEAPTEAPTATVEPTATATGTPAPFPTDPPPPTNPPRNPPVVPPTASPASAGEVEIACRRAPGSGALVAGSDAWALFSCALPREIGTVDTVDLRGVTETPGWQVILVANDAPDTPGLLDASNNRLLLDDLAETREITFLLGARLDCTAFTAARLQLEISGTRPGGSSFEATGAVALLAEPAAVPAATLAGFSAEADDDGATSTITVDYQHAQGNCGWQLVLSLGRIEGDLLTAPAGTLSLVGIDGPEGSNGSLGNGVVSVLIPAAEDGPSAGTITVTTRLEGDSATATAIDAVIVEVYPAP